MGFRPSPFNSAPPSPLPGGMPSRSQANAMSCGFAAACTRHGTLTDSPARVLPGHSAGLSSSSWNSNSALPRAGEVEKRMINEMEREESERLLLLNEF